MTMWCKSQALLSLHAKQLMEQAKSYPTIDWKKNEYHQLKEVVNLLKAIQERESKRHEMDAHLDHHTTDVIMEVISMLEEELDYDPTPQYDPALAGA